MASPLSFSHVPFPPRSGQSRPLTVSTTATPKHAAPAPKRPLITDRLVETAMALTTVELEERSIPAQGAGDVLYVYVGDVVVTHDIRRTLDVFDGDVGEAVDNIRRFILDGLIGEAPDRTS